jgi:hypothetical protein
LGAQLPLFHASPGIFGAMLGRHSGLSLTHHHFFLLLNKAWRISSSMAQPLLDEDRVASNAVPDGKARHFPQKQEVSLHGFVAIRARETE